MKILISILSLISSLFLGYRRGVFSEKQKQERKNDKEKIRILEAKIETKKTIANLSDDDVNSKLSAFFDRKK